jgi:dihydrofolate reductase
MKLILIAALNKKRVIGINGKIPWNIPEDLQRFKRLTTNHTVLMGRKTFESIGKQLFNRRNIVLTSSKIPAVETFSSLNTVLQKLSNEEKVFVIGGEQVFTEALPLADELNLTIVNNTVDGDTFFPPYEHLIGSSFNLQSKEDFPGFSFNVFEKIAKP